jgi:hypothetical protein
MQRESAIYTPDYYETNVDQAALASARQVVPFLIEQLAARSMLELGAGSGTWSRAALDSGISDVLAVDGPWTRPEALRLPPASFVFHDLSEPFHAHRQFDLALCLEVGEHLKLTTADTLIDSLARHSSIIVFGAAMPFQGGSHHVNEQWPSFWRERFEERGYSAIDAIRPIFWNNPEVAYYYKQNTFIYVQAARHPALVDRLQALARDGYRVSRDFVFIHPDKYCQLAGFENVNVRLMLKRGAGLLARAAIGRVTRFLKAAAPQRAPRGR